MGSIFAVGACGCMLKPFLDTDAGVDAVVKPVQREELIDSCRSPISRAVR
jgi:hypothetical protein